MKSSSAWWVFALLLLPVPSRARAQKDTAPLVKEQARLEERFRYLQDLMKRLARRYSGEGEEQHHKQLLEAGLDFIRSSNIENLLVEAKNDLEAGRTFSARKKQKEAEARLQDLYDLLLERKKTQNFEKEVKRQEKNLAEIENLLDLQRKLQEKTRKAVEKSFSKEEKDLLAGLEALLKKQEALSRRTESLQPPGTAAAEDVLQALKDLSAKIAKVQENLGPSGKGRGLLQEVKNLLEKQKTLGKALRRGEKAREEAARLRSLAARARALPPKGLARESDAAQLFQDASTAAASPEAPPEMKEALKEFGKLAGDPSAADRISALLEKGAARKEKESAARTARLAEAFRAQAREAARTSARAGGDFPRAARHLRRAGRDNDSAGRETAQGNQDQAEAWNEQATLELEQALAALQSEGADPGRSLRERAFRARSLARRLREEGISKDGAGRVAKAAGDLSRGGDQADRRNWKEAARAAQAGKARVDQVIQALSRELKKRTAGIVGEARKEARDQAALEKEAGKLQASMEQAAREGKLAPAQKEGASSALDEARKAMDRSRKNLEAARLEGARRAQDQAARALARAEEALRAGHRAAGKAKEELARLAREQEKIRKRILQLARRMDPRKDRDPKNDLEQAAQSAGQAGQSLQQGDSESAGKKEDETRRKLEEARKKVARKRDHYLSLRQEELLLNMKQELEKLLAAHQEVRRETKDIDLRIQERNGLVGRATRRALRRLASKEKDLAGTCTFIRKTLEKEGSLVFSRVLLEAGQDLEEIARLLTSRPPVTGDLVQGIQEDVALHLGQLLGALKKEVARRRKAPPRPSSNRGPRKKKLVPDVAELKMLKALQEDLMKRTRNLQEEAGVPGGESLLQAEIERLANRQNDLNQVFKEFLKKIGIGKPAPGGTPGKKSGKEKKGK